MRILRLIKTDFCRNFCSKTFAAGLVLTIVLCFTSVVYIDPLRDDRYSVIQLFFKFSRDELLTDARFCAEIISISGAGSWFCMFAPFVAAFSFALSFCDEKDSRFVRFSVFRSGRWNYHFGKIVSGMLCSGLTLGIGYLIYMGIVFILFPSASEYSLQRQDEIALQLGFFFAGKNIQNGMFVFWQLLGVFLYGVILAGSVLLFCALTKNKYVVACMPFFIHYALSQSCIKVLLQAYRDWEHPKEVQALWANCFNTDTVSTLFRYEAAGKILLVQGIGVMVCLVLYGIIVKRRLDCGE